MAALAARHGVPFLCERALWPRRTAIWNRPRGVLACIFFALDRRGQGQPRRHRPHLRRSGGDGPVPVAARVRTGGAGRNSSGDARGTDPASVGRDRAEVEEFLRPAGIVWREDASNQDARFARNRIRHDLLPQLAREWNPRIARTLAHLADLAREEEHWWQEEISRLAKDLLVVVRRGHRSRSQQTRRPAKSRSPPPDSPSAVNPRSSGADLLVRAGPPGPAAGPAVRLRVK